MKKFGEDYLGAPIPDRAVQDISGELTEIDNMSEDYTSEQTSSDKHGIRHFTKEYSPWARKKLADQISYARKMYALKTNSKEDTQKQISDLKEAFYERFTKQKEEFEGLSKENSIEEISRKYGVVLVHTFPVEGMSRWNTTMNNEEMGGNEMNLGSLLASVKEKGHDLSCSSVSIDKRYSSVNDNTMYPVGVVLKGGNILSAYRFDASTLTEKGALHKKSKYDDETQDTSIHPDILKKIDNVLTRRFDKYQNPETGYYDVHRHYKTGEFEPHEIPEKYHGYSTSDQNGYDEFIVSHPEIDGFYINLDDSRLQGEWNDYVLNRVNKLVQEHPGAPVYIKNKGELRVYAYDSEGNARVISSEEELRSLGSL